VSTRLGQVRAMKDATSSIAAWTAATFAKLTPLQVAAVEAHQLALLTGDKLRALPPECVAALSIEQLLALSPAQVRCPAVQGASRRE